MPSSNFHHPYRGLPSYHFWSSALAQIPGGELDPIVNPRFTIGRNDAVAAAGSCFAQHIARYLRRDGFRFLETEAPASPAAPQLSARFGNIYTVRQLRQLLLRAYGLLRPADHAWRRPDGRFIDPFRPQIFVNGFAGRDAVEEDRVQHLRAVRKMFEEVDVFVFTLGLTESWLSEDGTALLIPPGIIAAEADGLAYRFHNFTVDEMRDEMSAFLQDFRDVNPGARVILTVSPVPMVATFENRHVLVSNTYSKSALRVVAEEACKLNATVEYFPAYEIITAPSLGFRYFESDLRSVSEPGLEHVMRIFSKHFLSEVSTSEAGAGPQSESTEQDGPVAAISDERRAQLLASASTVHQTMCDEDLLYENGNS